MAKSWEELTVAEQAQVLRTYGGPEMEAIWAQANGGRGLTDEELVNTPMLWPPTGNAPAGTVTDGNFYLSDMAAGNTMNATGQGTIGGVADITGSVDSYDPNRGLSPEDTKAYAGVRPGVQLDPEAYARTPEGKAAMALAASQRSDIAARAVDPNRFAIDPGAAQQAASGTVTYSPVDARNAFQGTTQALNIGTNAAAGLMTTGRQGMMGAAEVARLAAMGKAPSAAENMYLQAGADAAASYRRSALDAQTFARQKSGALAAQQAAMAAGQRGAVSGLAGLQAMNNTALGQAQVYQQAIDAQQRANIDATSAMTQAQYQAAAARASEMATSRELYVQAEQAMRAGDIQAAQQLTQLAQVKQQSEQSQLQAEQTNAAKQLEAGQFNVGAANTVNAANADRTLGAMQGNQSTALGATAQDDAAAQAYDSMLLGETEADRKANIQQTETRQDVIDNQAATLANIYTNNATNRTNRGIATGDREARKEASLIGAAGTLVGGLIQKSDERSKHIDRQASPPDFRKASMADLAKRLTSQDFRRAQDSVYTYKGDKSGTKYTGPMAQQLPTNVQTRGPDGMRYVDTGRLAMNLASAVGRLQKKVGV